MADGCSGWVGGLGTIGDEEEGAAKVAELPEDRETFRRGFQVN